jgi:retron-type reverse transcriptase
MKILEKRVKDKLILGLIRSGLKAKIITQDYKLFFPEVGTPQGGILSPLLSNIYLDQLDKYIIEKAKEYLGPVKSGDRKKNPETRKLLNQGKKSEVYKRKLSSRDPFEKGYRNIKYIRYADDFLVGILGPRELAIEVRNQIQTYLREELKIELSMEKTKITHVSKGIPFLGYIFTRRSMHIKQRYAGKIVNRHMTTPLLKVNFAKVVKRLAIAGFCDFSGKPKPLFKYLRAPQSEVNRKVN